MATQIEDSNLIICIEQCWSTDSNLGLKGWCVSKIGDIDRLYLIGGDHNPISITSFLPRPDIFKRYPQYLNNDLCGFSVRIERTAKHMVTARIMSGERNAEAVFLVDGQPPTKGEHEWFDILAPFVNEVNSRHLKVLEVGSRIVPGTESKRHLFHNDVRYVGFDYYKDENTDVVGDAHMLSKYFENEKFGAIFSFSVLEHTVMPWVVALEMIKLVELGGLILAHVPSALPPHEQPSDFWRISPDGLKVLFSPSLGMNVEAVLYDHPLHMYVDNPVAGWEMLPTNPAYGFAGILARKVSEIDYSRYKWFSSHEEIIGCANFYPTPIT